MMSLIRREKRNLNQYSFVSCKIAFAILAVSIFGSFQAAQGQTKLPAERFVEAATTGAPALSPSGRYLAIPRFDEKAEQSIVLVVDVTNLATPKMERFALPKTLAVGKLSWKTDSRLILSLAIAQELAMKRRVKIMTGASIVAIDANGQNAQPLMPKFTLGGRQLLHLLPDDPNHVLMTALEIFGTYPSLNVYRVNLESGSSDLIARGSRYTDEWLTDTKGALRIRIDDETTSGQRVVFSRNGDSDDWTEIARYDMRDYPNLNIVGFGDDPRTALVSSRQGNDKLGLYEYDLKSRTIGKLLYQNPHVDVGWPIGGPIYEPATTRLIGVSYARDVWFRHYLDPQFQSLQMKLEATFPDASSVTPSSWSRDLNKIVITVSTPKLPAAYFLYDTKTGQASSIGRAYDNLPNDSLGEMFAFSFSARDGAKIPGYLTLPPGKGKTGLPLVVLAHGGPELRDTMSYDSWVQFLANRGYAVFQPNFRGSGGYGKAFLEAGYRQWGRRMQDDITDGVKALIADGTADANRVCIMGASYGGYAALAGGAFTPELYKCVVSIAGVADIEQMLKDDRFNAGSDSYAYAYWKRWVGDPKTDLDEIKAWSPINHVGKFAAPVLLVHGREDTNVRVSQSAAMEDALRKAGKPVKFVRLRGENHTLSDAATLELFKALDDFLPQHIGN